MGCFLACFGSSKDRKRRKQRHRVQPRHQRTAGYTAHSTVSLVENYSEKASSSVELGRDKPEELLNLSARKKVTFDSNVKTYEHVVLDESIDFSAQNEEGNEVQKEKEKENNLAKQSQSESSSEHGSITSSSSSYPPSHRYQNCRESDDEGDELGCEESDLDDDDGALEDEGFYDDFDDGIVESRATMKTREEIDGLVEEVVNPVGSNRGVRDRSAYVHSVLNPVENLTQWKAVKAKEAPLKRQKENFRLEEEPRISFSTEPCFNELSLSFKSKPHYEPKQIKQEVAVDASLSTWLSSSETTPVKNRSTFDASTPEKSISQGSNPIRSPEDRPILGALTLDEIKQFSASSSPRKSPSRSPDDMPIIGTVGTYWSHTSTKDSESATSFKGIPNTTSKYKEDRKVNWHSTPFETRLERALNRGAAEAYSSR